METYTLCIPRVLKDIPCSKIRKLLESSKIGNVLFINEYNSNDSLYKKVVFTIGSNENAENSHLIKKCIDNDENIKLVYNYPWYWRIYVNTPASNTTNTTNTTHPHS
tara:strand:+ start:703 stop:1023 length:321 start_codon:yes stop_codon:yes gene_type:complete